jgi:hypothetical protein
LLQVMESMGIEVALPVIVHVHNVGAIFMAENATATSRTRHLDARYHFVREYVEVGVIKFIFVRSGLNCADGFTKNVTSDIYEAHQDTYITQKEYLEHF